MSAYNICKLLIKYGRTAGLQEKVDMFYACGRVTDEEYTELTNTLTPATTTAPAGGDSAGGTTGTSGQ